MGDRVLAHIERVVKTYPIMHEDKYAEKVEMTQVLDFHVITQKGQFKEGDLALYIEVGSILPETPAVEFLRPKKFTIKAMKMGSKFTSQDGGRIISQGIMFKPEELLGSSVTPVEGLDVTEALGITKVIEDAEEDASFKETKELTFTDKIDKTLMRFPLYRKVKKSIMGQSVKGTWQDWMPAKSDEENIQKLFTKLKNQFGDDDGWYVTSKLEGQSISAYIIRSKYFFGLKTRTTKGVCSRTRNLITDDGSRFWLTTKELGLHDKLGKLSEDYFWRGEHVGGKIQGNIYKLPKHDIYMYDIWNIKEQRKLNYMEMLVFCQENNLKMCPIIDDKFKLPNTVQELLDYSNRYDELVPGVKVLGEGVVIRRKDNPNISFKVKSPEYMLKHNK